LIQSIFGVMVLGSIDVDDYRFAKATLRERDYWSKISAGISN
jgi:hypothetical protein